MRGVRKRRLKEAVFFLVLPLSSINVFSAVSRVICTDYMYRTDKYMQVKCKLKQAIAVVYFIAASYLVVVSIQYMNDEINKTWLSELCILCI